MDDLKNFHFISNLLTLFFSLYNVICYAFTLRKMLKQQKYNLHHRILEFLLLHGIVIVSFTSFLSSSLKLEHSVTGPDYYESVLENCNIFGKHCYSFCFWAIVFERILFTCFSKMYETRLAKALIILYILFTISASIAVTILYNIEHRKFLLIVKILDFSNISMICIILYLSLYYRKVQKNFSYILSQKYHVQQNIKSLAAVLPLIISNTIFQSVWVILKITFNILFIFFFRIFNRNWEVKKNSFHELILRFLALPFKLATKKTSKITIEQPNEETPCLSRKHSESFKQI
uniref:Serpentine receptor class gamma n=1 Tax=Rhabditophanes sp. KR3021 TaxID=114890 RepID=A0AC35UH41_9BILA